MEVSRLETLKRIREGTHEQFLTEYNVFEVFMKMYVKLNRCKTDELVGRD